MDKIEPVFNIHVADNHTYFVGDNKSDSFVLVHNQSSMSGATSLKRPDLSKIINAINGVPALAKDPAIQKFLANLKNSKKLSVKVYIGQDNPGMTFMKLGSQGRDEFNNPILFISQDALKDGPLTAALVLYGEYQHTLAVGGNYPGDNDKDLVKEFRRVKALIPNQTKYIKQMDHNHNIK
jgi:hypothetical protein